MRPIIICMIKDEHLYIEEWIEYHLALGFEHIYLFEDFTSKSHLQLLSKYEKVTLYTVPKEIPQNGLRQKVLFNSMMYQDIFKDAYAAFIDVDEFIMLDKHETLLGLLDEFKDEKAFGMVWHNYNASGHIERPKVPTIEAYTDWEYYYDMKYGHKAFVNMKFPYFFTSMHSVEGMLNTSHEVFKFNDDKDKLSKRIWINHYFTKSWEDWLVRMKRGQVSVGLRKLEHFFTYNPDMEPLRESLISSAKEKLG